MLDVGSARVGQLVLDADLLALLREADPKVGAVGGIFVVLAEFWTRDVGEMDGRIIRAEQRVRRILRDPRQKLFPLGGKGREVLLILALDLLVKAKGGRGRPLHTED